MWYSKNFLETVYTDILRKQRLLGMHESKKGNGKIEYNKDIPDGVKNIKSKEQCSFKNNRKSPIEYKGDENKYRGKEKCAMNNKNEYKALYENIAKDMQGKGKFCKNKNKKKFFLFKPFSFIDSYFERIIFNVFASIDKFRNNKSSNKLNLALMAITKITLLFAIPILFILMACLIVLNVSGGDGEGYKDNYIHIVFISIGTIMIIYLLIKVLRYSYSTKKHQLYRNNK
ncbi:Plasmodium exported protein, unknown function [Plasmodium vivax]|uniref:Uncharacterized protein n=1 Tax=Plasmodium vivax TaxID=5855 RepID=A0A565A6L9_PLAVI|nr:Plasmodium exported protein, unknown function [Plasmodium vivax]